MNEFKEHKGCVSGLETVTRLTFSYQMAEQTFLGPSDTRELYKKATINLYKKVLEYQALAIRYFGRSTLKRMGINVGTAFTQWADMPSILSELDKETRRSLNFLGQQKCISTLLAIDDTLIRLENELRDFIQSARAKGDDVAEITRWATSIMVELDHRDVRKELGELHYSSGRWFLEHSSLQAWKQWKDGYQCLWLKGGVGAGKSSLASMLIEDLVQSPAGLIAFFYCSKKNDEHKGSEGASKIARSNHENALKSIVAQIAVSKDGKEVYSGLQTLFNLDQGRKGPHAGFGLSLVDCLEMLNNIFTECHKDHFTIIIDALDECVDYDSFLGALAEAASSNRNVRFFFSSRLEVKVQDYFPEAKPVDLRLQNTKDIEEFMEIEFIWVKLELNLFMAEVKSDRIRLQDDIEDRLRSLENSKASGKTLLFDTYEKIYQKAIGGQNNEKHRRHAVTAALQWVLCAFRTLTWRELAFAISVRDDGSLAPGIEEGLLMDFCSNLLIEDSAGAVQIAHLSVRHYLEAREFSDFVPEAAHHQAALTCLYFLTSSHVKEFSKPKNTNATLTEGFEVYMAHYWSRHCRVAKKNEVLRDLVVSLPAKTPASPDESATLRKIVGMEGISASGEQSPSACRMYHELFVEFYQQVNSSTTSDIAVAPVIEQFTALGGDLRARSRTGTTLLHECTRFQLDDLSKLLMDSGAPVDARDQQGHTALHIAAMHQAEHGTRLLLLAGADKNATNFAGQTPLHVSIAFGCHQVAEIILSANARGLEKDIRGDSPMHYAAAMGYSVFIESLLLLGYSPNEENLNLETSLTLAIDSCHSDVVKVLLEHGAVIQESDRVKMRDSRDRTLTELALQVPQCDIPNAEPTKNSSGFPYTIEFEDKSARLCDFCDIAQWVTAPRKGTAYRHHASFSDLESSAEEGCPMCRLFSDDLKEKEISVTENRVDAAFMVRLEPCSGQGSRPDRKDKLVLSCNEADMVTYELCTDDSLPSLPTFVLDVGVDLDESTIRLVETNSEMKENYVYLSSRWGVKPGLMLKSYNISLLKESIAFGDLPPGLGDAVTITRRLGLRYLWIDALRKGNDYRSTSETRFWY
ncbi:hypothetical protein N0V93_004767 [Gnomoniopsis smithogilvyi]|uniref:Ankyrin repeat protein n=1 Tax=Gnomoniopsis smithogilvyi TaxID=1191159 RepID=A0A9W8YRM6_9PEZI|nr:hypothetical protein N0V93_004767 [Gnomoniopsis smithogilvyi]